MSPKLNKNAVELSKRLFKDHQYRQQKHLENIEKHEKQQPKYSFKPELQKPISPSAVNQQNPFKPLNSNQQQQASNIIQRAEEWKREKEEKLKRKQQEQAENQINDCELTFKPKTNSGAQLSLVADYAQMNTKSIQNYLIKQEYAKKLRQDQSKRFADLGKTKQRVKKENRSCSSKQEKQIPRSNSGVNLKQNQKPVPGGMLHSHSAAMLNKQQPAHQTTKSNQILNREYDDSKQEEYSSNSCTNLKIPHPSPINEPPFNKVCSPSTDQLPINSSESQKDISNFHSQTNIERQQQVVQSKSQFLTQPNPSKLQNNEGYKNAVTFLHNQITAIEATFN